MCRVFVDTNVFLRFLTRDDPAKAEKARRLFAATVAGELVAETSLLVIAEIVRTLEPYYGLSHDEVAEARADRSDQRFGRRSRTLRRGEVAVPRNRIRTVQGGRLLRFQLAIDWDGGTKGPLTFAFPR